MQALILCGGKGTRMREETEFKPKPMVEIGGRPILWHIMKLYAHYGQKNFTLCLGYKGEMIQEYFRDHREPDFGNVILADTGQEELTGARVKRVEQHIIDDTFMVTYGDGLSNVNIDALLKFHRSHGKLATLTAFHPVSHFGVLDIDNMNRVRSFAEKIPLQNWISAGYFVFDRKVLDYLSTDPMCMLEGAPLERLAKEGELMAYRHEGTFFPVDTYRDYLRFNDMWNKGDRPWAVWERSNVSATPSIALA